MPPQNAEKIFTEYCISADLDTFLYNASVSIRYSVPMRQFEQTVLSFLLLRIGIGGEGVTERFLVIGSEIEPMHVTIGNNIGEA